tara:strand:- start:21512 stop:22444 length:933 start_codon:yes stop_codon:yes gene_type:complete
MDKKVIRIATRKSPLALWQAEYVQAELKKYHPSVDVQLLPMNTQGDIILDTPLAKIGGKGLFLKELQRALLEKKADIAVHSIKDVPVSFPQGLILHTICERDDPSDAFVCEHYPSLEALPEGAVVGTSSLRRQCQLLALRPDLITKDLRGNVGTRLQKLDRGDYDAIILATAGLKRLHLDSRIRHTLPITQMLPANAQGAVGIECREDDIEVQKLLAPLEHALTRYRVLAERAMNARLDGGCQVPIGSYSEIQGDQLTLYGLVGSIDGQRILKAERTGSLMDSVALGTAVAEDLLQQGAQTILDEVYQEQ